MTAEVGVMNRLGVALAADSAVSIGHDAEKIWTSADKLFQLSYIAPVGVMIYGNADFVGIPWETIVKEYRRGLGNRTFDRLSDYALDFLRFLRQHRQMFPDTVSNERVTTLILSLFFHLRDQIEDTMDREAEKRNGLDEKDIPSIVADVVKKRLELIKARTLLPGFGAEFRARLASRLRAKIEDAEKTVFAKLPIMSVTRRHLTLIALEMLSRQYFGPFLSGLVVAGFGDRDFTPSLLAYEIEEMVERRPRSILVNENHVDSKSSAIIVPFAQQEMVHSFLRGIESDMDSYIRRSTKELFEGALESVFSAIQRVNTALGNKLRDATSPELKKILNGLFQDWDKKCRDYWQPVVEIVSSLPKDELAAMAEAFVNLTKFRRRVTPERETVGGPIDVAVITKADGFVWVKRKHYFDAALNPRVVARYMGEGKP